MNRSSGILLHIASLASPYGIGAMGEAALRFVDFLASAGVRYWQLLPLGPTGAGDSPYQSESAFAGNFCLIDMSLLVAEGLLTQEECQEKTWGDDPARIDYEKVAKAKEELLRLAFSRTGEKRRAEHRGFAVYRPWLADYALYRAIKKAQKEAPFYQWPQPLRRREEQALRMAREELWEEVAYQYFLQYTFYWQFAALKSYGAQCGVKLIGDLPIYVSADSADVWSNQGLFDLDSEGKPAHLAGVPPDAFSEEGQLWGNPLYDWEAMAKRDYDWWGERIKASLTLFDVVRIDHFRGFDSFWEVDPESPTAKQGRWRQGPGIALFDSLRARLGELPIIAEDLGILTDSVRELLRVTGFPGMKVLQFAFSEGYESDYLPHNSIKNTTLYTGTHDNDTIRGWLSSLDSTNSDYCREYLQLQKGDEVWGLIRAAWASTACLAVTTAQDLLELDTTARMNTPGTMSKLNWSFRMLPNALNEEHKLRLERLCKLYYRN